MESGIASTIGAGSKNYDLSERKVDSFSTNQN